MLIIQISTVYIPLLNNSEKKQKKKEKERQKKKKVKKIFIGMY